MFSEVSLQATKNLYSVNPDERYHRIINIFKEKYQKMPDFITRAPGRVNIIGQHIDYQGYGVLPAAIQKDCLMAIKIVNQPRLVIKHCEQNLYPSYETDLNPMVAQQFPNNYLKYFIAGYAAGISQVSVQKLVGLEVLIEGNIPVASGLSSSAALCVCAALSSLYANKQNNKITKVSLIQKCITSQRLMGSAFGGMDESISVLGKQNFCLHIQFNPIRSREIHLPEGFKFIVMNSLVESDKLDTAAHRYNKRVCQCRLALYVIAANMGISTQGKNWKILQQLHEWTKLSLPSMEGVVEQFIRKQPYTKKQIQDELEQKIETLLEDIPLSTKVVSVNTTYKLYEAAKHVYAQSFRVIKFIEVCDSKLGSVQKAMLLGNLMNQSQKSCKQLYECSCAQLDELTSTARTYGAIGSRLTGAGWGGCTVSLLPNQKVPLFIESLKNSYYSKPNLKQRIKELDFQKVVFQTQPSEGACIIKL